MARWIKIYDGLLEWEWHKRPEMVSLFVHLLMMANTKDGRFEGHEIKKGQLATSLASLSETTGLTTQTLRTCLKHLQQTGEISIKSTSRFSIISICKYDDYQVRENGGQQTANKQLTNDQQAPNKQLTTIIEYKNIDKEITNTNVLVKEKNGEGKSIEQRQAEFREKLKEYEPKYGKAMIDDFFSYWGEPNRSLTKMRCEQQPTWSLSGRLATWKKRDDERKFNKPDGKPSTRFVPGMAEGKYYGETEIF